MKRKGGAFLVVRVRGTVNVRRRVDDTMKQLHLHRSHTATIIPNSPEYFGMLHAAKDWISWSPVTSTFVEKILKSRGRMMGAKPIEANDVKKWGFKSMRSLCSSISKGEVQLKNLEGLKPFFRLAPPRGGFKKTIRRGSTQGGVLGQYPGLPALAERMLA